MGSRMGCPFLRWQASCRLPGEVDTIERLPRAVQDFKVAYVAGPSFYPDRSGKSSLRICLSLVKEDLIPEGIRRLAQVLAP